MPQDKKPSATFRQWDSGPETRFSAMRPFSIGFAFDRPVRLDRIETQVLWDAFYDRAQCAVEIGKGRGWQRIQDDFQLDARFPEVYRLRGIHRFAPVTTRRIRFVLRDSYRQYYDAYALAVFHGDRTVARHDPLAGTPFFEFRKAAFGSFTDDAIRSISTADAPDRYQTEIRRQRTHLWRRRDTLGDAILREGEPDEARIRRYFPPIRFASTVIGHPGRAPCNLRVDWNGTLLFDPYRGAYGPETADRLHNCAGFYFRKVLAFVVGPTRVRFGFDRDRLRPLTLDRGYRPRVTTAYRAQGIDYRIELFSLQTGSRVETWLAFRAVNRGAVRRPALLGMEPRNFLMHETSRPLALNGSRAIDEGDREVLRASLPLEQDGSLFFHCEDLAPGGKRTLYARINPSWYEGSPTLGGAASATAYRHARRRFDALWDGIIGRCVAYRVPDKRFEHGFYAGIVSLLLHADAQRRFVYYGSMSTYDRTLYYIESPHAPLALGAAGLGHESRALFMGLFDVLGRMDKDYFQYLPMRHYLACDAWLNYLLCRDKTWLRRIERKLRPYMDEVLALIDASPLGLLPPKGFGGDVQDRKVISLNSNLCGCFGLLAHAAMLAELGDARADTYRQRAEDYLATVMARLEDSLVDTEWGRKAYSLILDDDGGPEFDFGEGDGVKVVERASSRKGVGAHQYYFGGTLQPVFRNNFSCYLALFSSILLGTSLLNRYPRQRRRIVAFLEQGGGVFGGLPRAKGLDVNPTYGYGYRRACLEDGKKDRFVLAAYADLYAATSELFQAAESLRIVPWPRWGVVENKRTVGVSEHFVGRVRTALDMFVLEEFHGPHSTGRIRIAAGVPDAWWSHRRAFGIKQGRFSGGRIDVWLRPLRQRRTRISVRCPDAPRDITFEIVLPRIEDGTPAPVRESSRPCRSVKGLAVVRARGSFWLEIDVPASEWRGNNG